MTASSAWPGRIHTGADLRPIASSTISTSSTMFAAGLTAESSADVFACGLTSAALSQVSFVSGLGNSCSQPLLANRPS